MLLSFLAKPIDLLAKYISTEEDDSSESEAVNMFSFARRHCNKVAGPGVSLNIAEEKKSREKV